MAKAAAKKATRDTSKARAAAAQKRASPAADLDEPARNARPSGFGTTSTVLMRRRLTVALLATAGVGGGLLYAAGGGGGGSGGGKGPGKGVGGDQGGDPGDGGDSGTGDGGDDQGGDGGGTGETPDGGDDQNNPGGDNDEGANLPSCPSFKVSDADAQAALALVKPLVDALQPYPPFEEPRLNADGIPTVEQRRVFAPTRAYYADAVMWEVKPESVKDAALVKACVWREPSQKKLAGAMRAYCAERGL